MLHVSRRATDTLLCLIYHMQWVLPWLCQLAGWKALASQWSMTSPVTEAFILGEY